MSLFIVLIMNNFQIDQICSNDHILKKFYRGIYPSNKLPPLSALKPRSKCFLIANLDPDTMDGSHWVLLYIRGNTCYYFDSFGKKPKGAIRRYIEKSFSLLKYNNVTAQKDTAVVCGGLFVLNVFTCTMLQVTVFLLHEKCQKANHYVN